MKFTTLIPKTWNDGTLVETVILEGVIESIWRPFRGMTRDEKVSGHWIDDDGTEFADEFVRLAIECDRSRLQEAISAVRRAGRRLRQRAMYFEVSGYDGVQFLRMQNGRRKSGH